MPGRTLGHRRQGRANALGRQLGILSHVHATPVPERLEKPRDELRPAQAGGHRVHIREFPDQLLDGGVTSGGGQRGRLDDGQRADRLRPPRRDQQSNDRAVGMPHEVGAVAEQGRNVVGIDLEVGRTAGGAGAIAATAGQHQRVTVCQGTLRAEGEGSSGGLPWTQTTRAPQPHTTTLNWLTARLSSGPEPDVVNLVSIAFTPTPSDMDLILCDCAVTWSASISISTLTMATGSGARQWGPGFMCVAARMCQSTRTATSLMSGELGKRSDLAGAR